MSSIVNRRAVLGVLGLGAVPPSFLPVVTR